MTSVRTGTFIPCYCLRGYTDGKTTEEKVEKHIKAVCKKIGKYGIAMFSVTSEEKNHKVWIDTAKKFKGCKITRGLTRQGNGTYKVWMITIPVPKQPRIIESLRPR